MILAMLLAAIPLERCAKSEELAQQEMNICAWEEFQRADAAMNAQWKRTVAELKRRDTEVDRSYDNDPGYYETTLAAQRAWLIWRDQHCLAESFAARGGSLAPLLKSTCKTALTEERTKQLKTIVDYED